MWGSLALTMALLASPALAGGDQYWWMDQQDVFSGRNGNSGGHRNQNFQQSSQSYPDNSNNNNFGGSNDVETQCPAGTKCVSEFFCDENAVMVNYRVDLTPAQIRKRGELLPCMNRQTGQFDVCCSTAAPGLPLNTGGSRPSNNFQQQQRPSNNFQQGQRLQQRPSNNNNNFNNNNNNIPQGSCPAINNLPDISSCDGMVSNCWSVGQADVDCPGNALCCFDGCRNTCYFGAGGAPPPRPSRPAPAPAPAPRPPPRRPAPAPAPAPALRPPPRRPAPAPAPRPDPPAIPTPPPRRQTAFQSQSQPQPQPAFDRRPAASQAQGTFSQSPVSSSTGQCPNISPLSGNQCSNERDTCWNTDRRDDCSRGFYCCFDGCVKTCYNLQTGEFLRHPQSQLQNQGGPAPVQPVRRPVSRPAPAPAPAPRPPAVNPRRPSRPQPSRPQPSFQQSRPSTQHTSQSYQPPQDNYQPQPSVQNVQVQRPRIPSRPRPAAHRPSNNQNNFQQRRPSFQQQQPQQQQHQSSGPVQPADTKPFVKCPAAMECVQREYCDLEGFISETPINTTPQLEMLRVSLITCVSPVNQAIDVCCRDPNYVDPWPGGMNKNGNNGGNFNNQGFNSGNQGFNNPNNNQGFNQPHHHHQQQHSGSSSGGSRRGGYGK